MNATENIALHEALSRMWAKFLPEMEERVAILETAAAAFAAEAFSAASWGVVTMPLGGAFTAVCQATIESRVRLPNAPSTTPT